MSNNFQAAVRDEGLPALEQDMGATVLIARDYGSHDAILMDPGSDRDVAVIAAHPPTQHAHVEEPSGRVRHHTTLNDTLTNFAGFNLANFAREAAASEPQALTIVAAETEYFVHPDIREDIHALFDHIQTAFNPPELIAHYRKLARANYGSATSDDWEYTGADGPQWTIRNRGASRYLVTGILGYDEHETEQPVEEAIDEGVLTHADANPTVQQNLRIADALLSAQHVAQTGEFPPAEFEALLDARVDPTVTAPPVTPQRDTPDAAVPPLPQSTADTLRTLAERKRQGDGDDEVGFVLDEWATPLITDDGFAVAPTRIAMELRDIPTTAPPNRHPDSAVIDTHVDAIIDTIF